MENIILTTSLVYPPMADVTQMYPAIPSLAGYLKSHGKKVRSYDANIDFYTSLLTPNNLERTLRKRRNKLSTSVLPVSDESRRWLEISEILFDECVSNLDSALETLRTIDIYHDVEKYRWCTNIIENSLYILSGKYKDVRLGLFSISMKYSPDSSADIRLAISDPQGNPFIDYFSRALSDGLLEGIIETDLIGISVTYQSQLIPAFTLAKLIRDHSPEIKIVVGGQFLTQSVDLLINTSIAMEFFDYAVTHEGETALRDLVNHLEGQIPEEEIPNLINLKNLENYRMPALVTCGMRKGVHLENMDELPTPDYSDFPVQKYLSPTVLLLAPTRGCYWDKCSFCDISPATRKNYRERSVEKVADDIARLSSMYSTPYFNFSVDAMAPKYLRKLAYCLIYRGLQVKWGAELRLEKTFRDKEFADLLYKAGLRYVFFGFESGSQKVIDLADKGTSVAISEKIIRVFAESGINIYLAWIVGLPGEKEDEFMESVNFVDRNKQYIHTAGVSPFYLQRDSAIARNPEIYGVKIIDTYKDLEVRRNYEITTSFTQQEADQIARQARDFLDKTFILFTTGGLNPHSFLSSMRMKTALRVAYPDKLVNDNYIISPSVTMWNSEINTEKWYAFDAKQQKLIMISEGQKLEMENISSRHKENLTEFCQRMIKQDFLKPAQVKL